jgi:hypothetical protein
LKQGSNSELWLVFLVPISRSIWDIGSGGRCNSVEGTAGSGLAGFVSKAEEGEEEEEEEVMAAERGGQNSAAMAGRESVSEQRRAV